jgi:hypothetical protein
MKKPKPVWQAPPAEDADVAAAHIELDGRAALLFAPLITRNPRMPDYQKVWLFGMCRGAALLASTDPVPDHRRVTGDLIARRDAVVELVGSLADTKFGDILARSERYWATQLEVVEVAGNG